MFANTYSKLPEHFFQRVSPERFSDPKLICFNSQLAEEICKEANNFSQSDLAQIFSGQKILEGSEPLAMAYAGMQFGHMVPQLGDGRAQLLGEISGYDIQLKGSGRTKFSREGDGRSALGPVIREYLVSEAMHALGVPTTRALCAVTTGEKVYRQFGYEPGGIFTRVASSHLRVGTFQYFAIRDDLSGIKTLFNYTLDRHYPELKSLSNDRAKAINMVNNLIERQANLIAQWMSFGFIHGVMNTDNFSVGGITIDYGPCAFMDDFQFDKSFSSIDSRGRYSFDNQVPIAQWNILRFVESILPLIDTNQENAIKIIEKEIIPKLDLFEDKRDQIMARKLGITDYQNEDKKLTKLFLTYLENNKMDFTMAFRNLPRLFNGDDRLYKKSPDLETFLGLWKKRVRKLDDLNQINPIYIPRNHQVQRVIDGAYENQFEKFHEALSVFTQPFKEDPDLKDWSLPPKPEEQIKETFCGT